MRNFCVGAALALACSSHAATIQVPQDAPTIQAGIDAAVDGDVVVVDDGTYTGEGNRDLDFHGKAITVRSLNGPSSCTLNVQGAVGDYHRGFIFQSGEGRDAVVEGFRIEDGFEYGLPLNGGAGIRCISSAPTIRNCVFYSNSSPRGSGIFLEGASPALVEDCTFDFNLGGGAMYVSGASDGAEIRGCHFENNYGGPYAGAIELDADAIVAECRFENNHTSSDTTPGGAISVSGNNAIISNCVFIHNSSELTGGALYAVVTDALVTNCIFYENSAPVGGGVHCDVFANVSLINCSFIRNDADQGGDVAAGHVSGILASLPTLINCTIIASAWDSGSAVHNFAEGGSVILNSIIRSAGTGAISGPPGVVSFSNIEGGYPGLGNIDVDPGFVDGDGGDYRLTDGSPCIDAGNTDLLPKFVTTDQTGFERVRDGNRDGLVGVDMGAFESPVPDSCVADGECGWGYRCDFYGSCGSMPGTCAPFPFECYFPHAAPVCGCDGADYDHPCHAALVGVNVAYVGACGQPWPDIDGDYGVDADDIELFMSFWGTSGPLGDLNLDGIVDGHDLGTLLIYWPHW
jgi:predicted outer membrane repeat protein